MSDHERRPIEVRGSIRSDDQGKGTVRMESLHDTEPDDLWSALTEAPRLARWIANIDGDLRVGGSFSASFTSGWQGSGRVEFCEPPRRLVVTLDPGTPEETSIEAVLSAEGLGTRLVVEERGIPLPEIALHGAGWQTHIEHLGSHLDGVERGDWRARWLELTSTYDDLPGLLR